ncbi:alcohol dehydrogenase catalytic domain-containing protein [Candidatus Microgenomates bacterium]|nr:alcohol dehydrogenase catalytic domain-containing protein [Candidatus Microgenomates bacterium]
MKVAQLTNFEGSNGIEIKDVEKPKITEGEILVQVHAAGVNPIDWKITHGVMPVILPITMGGDFSGTVLEVGANISNFKVNDEVYGQTPAFAGGIGTFAEFALVNANIIALKPINLNLMKQEHYRW